jgi:hypothetical protein
MLRSKAWILSVTLAAGSCSSGQLGSPTHDGSDVDTGALPDAGSAADVGATADAGVPACAAPVLPSAAPAAPAVVCRQHTISPVGGSLFEADVTVLGWDSGLVGCLAQLTQSFSHLATAARLLRVRTAAGEEYSFGLILPGLTPAIQVGDAAHLVDEIRSAHPFAPVYGRFELGNAAGLVLYIGHGGRPDQISAPAGVRIGFGKQLCAGDGSCGPWGELEVAVTIQGMFRSLAPNTSARVGSYLVVVGASEQETGPSTGNCLDWYVSRTEIGIAP